MANITPSQGVFTFKGISSADMGVLMLELPVRPTPSARGESKDVKGRDGKLWIPEYTYDRITIKCKMETAADANIDAVNAWLDGEGDLVFMDEPTKCYKARVIKGAERSHSSSRRVNRTWQQQWDCEPFRYEAEPTDWITINESETALQNPGTIESLPLLQLTVRADAQLMIGGVNTLVVRGFTGTLFVDCDAKVAYTGNGETQPYILHNHHVTGEWPVIPAGWNGVSFSNGITEVKILPRWRWL